MNTSKNGGNVPLTIDSNGNIVPRRLGVSRWAAPRKYDCTHKDCENNATLLSPGCPGIGMAHNCCAFHKEGVVSHEVLHI